MKLGLVTDCFPGTTLEEAAAHCRQLGFDQVELGCGNWSPAPHINLDALLADQGRRAHLTDTLTAHGLTLSALSCSGNPLFPGEKGAADRATVEKTFTLAEHLGLKTVVMMSGLPGGCPEDRCPNWIVTCWPPEVQDILRYQWTVAVPTWRQLIRQAHDHGVERIALELHGWQLVYNVDTFRRLRGETDATLGVNLDPSHLFWMGADPIAAATALGDAIYHVHIKDTRVEPAAALSTVLETRDVLDIPHRGWNYVTPGTGHDENWWRAFIGALRSAGYDGPLSMEQEDFSMPTMEALKQGVAVLRRAMA